MSYIIKGSTIWSPMNVISLSLLRTNITPVLTLFGNKGLGISAAASRVTCTVENTEIELEYNLR